MQPVKLNDDFLNDLGLGSLTADQKQAFLDHLYVELELRVGTELSKSLHDQQLEEFGKLIEEEDQQYASQWLENNCPNYKEVVTAELEKLKHEVITNREKILESVAV